jgi:PAS domain-containing protein
MAVSTGDLDSLVRDTEFFRSLVENGSDAIVSIDEHSTIIYANRSVERIFGYRSEEPIGEKPVEDLRESFEPAAGSKGVDETGPSRRTPVGDASRHES